MVESNQLKSFTDERDGMGNLLDISKDQVYETKPVLIEDGVLNLNMEGQFLSLSAIELTWVGEKLPPKGNQKAGPLSASIKSYSKGFKAPFLVSFDASESTGSIKKYHWDFGDGKTSAEKEPKHVFKKLGIYTVQLTITDKSSKTKQASCKVIVGESLTIHQSKEKQERYLPKTKIAPKDIWDVEIMQDGDFYIRLEELLHQRSRVARYKLNIDGKSYSLHSQGNHRKHHGKVAKRYFGKPLKVHLKKGKHILKLDGTLGWIRALQIYPAQLKMDE